VSESGSTTPSHPPVGPGEGVAPPDQAVPLDADDTRGMHLKRLLSHPITLSLGITFAIAGFVIGFLAGGAAIGGAGVIGVVLLVLLIVFVLASNKAKEDFFSSYAQARNLTRTPGRSHLPPSTPLLRKGDDRYADQVMNGTLPGGAPGAIGLYTYEVETTDSEGDKDTDYYRFTVVLHDIPSVAAKVSDVYCQRRSGFRFMDSAEDVFRRMNRLELESDALDKRYEIFYGQNDDEVWMKRLFSPSFIVWLAEQCPKNFAWELSAGSLCVNVTGHLDSAAELDGLCEAASQVAHRLAEEASQSTLPSAQ
jgi:hypothetical protein